MSVFRRAASTDNLGIPARLNRSKDSRFGYSRETTGGHNYILIDLHRLRWIGRELPLFVGIGRKSAQQIHRLYVLPRVWVAIPWLRSYAVGPVVPRRFSHSTGKNGSSSGGHGSGVE